MRTSVVCVCSHSLIFIAFPTGGTASTVNTGRFGCPTWNTIVGARSGVCVAATYAARATTAATRASTKVPAVSSTASSVSRSLCGQLSPQAQIPSPVSTTVTKAITATALAVNATRSAVNDSPKGVFTVAEDNRATPPRIRPQGQTTFRQKCREVRRASCRKGRRCRWWSGFIHASMVAIRTQAPKVAVTQPDLKDDPVIVCGGGTIVPFPQPDSEGGQRSPPSCSRCGVSADSALPGLLVGCSGSGGMRCRDRTDP